MEHNKFNNFYSKKSINDLIEHVRKHRSEELLIDKEWFEALKSHLFERDISIEEKKKIDYVLTAQPSELRKVVETVDINVKHSNNVSTDLTINPIKIVTAGKAIKSIVYVILIMTLSAVIGVIITTNSTDVATIKNTYFFIGIVSLICNIIILFQLYSTGDNLEECVTIK